MKNKRTIIILIMGVIVGLCISGVGTYAVTTYAISSNKISYTDNSSLGVDNVQAAIDGTCANIDTRLGDLENVSEKHLMTYATNQYYSMNGINGTHNYWYQIGRLVIVNISVKVLNSGVTSANIPIVFTGLPKPLYISSYGSLVPENSNESSGTMAIYSNGNIGILGGTINSLLNGTIIYVAE